MDEYQKRRVGEQVEPGDRPKAPGRLALLQRFVNTWNHDLPAEWDRLGTAAKAKAWLQEKGLLLASVRVTSRDAAQLRELRELLRAIVTANYVQTPTPAAALNRMSRHAVLRIALDPAGRSQLEPACTGVGAVVATLLGILHEARLSGDWPRLKGCRQCGYVFFDRSKNRSASWCTMSICGNRAKNRTYRRRKANQLAD